MKKFITSVLAVLALVIGSVALAAPANAAVVTQWPSYTTNPSPARNAAVGAYYSNGKPVTINLATCPSGRAEQLTAYPWTTINSARQPVWSKPAKFEKCLPPAARADATLVSAWPSFTSNRAPARTAFVGTYFHNPSKRIVVTTNKCASGKAEQGAFQQWGMIAGGYTPLSGTAYTKYFIKCL